LYPKDDKDIVVNYLIPPKIASAKITFSGKIVNASKKEVSFSETNVVMGDQNNKYIDNVNNRVYLRNTGDSGYIAKLMGKDGEPIAKQILELDFIPNWLTDKNIRNLKYFKICLQTDENGEVHLGRLANISRLIIMVNSVGANRMSSGKDGAGFDLNDNSIYYNLPKSFDIFEGEGLKLPAGQNHHSKKQYRLLRQEDEGNIEDCSNNIQEVGGLLVISTELKKGQYRLFYNLDYMSCDLQINVHLGERWKEGNMNYLVQEDLIMKLKHQNEYLIYNNLQVTNESIKFNVASNNPDRVKVHVFGYNYLPRDNESNLEFEHDTMFELYKGKNVPNSGNTMYELEKKEDNEIYKIKQNANTYLQTKKLSDEIQYVMDRKNKKTYMGNTLDTPQVILNRQFNKKTSK